MNSSGILKLACLVVGCFAVSALSAQHASHEHHSSSKVEAQPLLAQALRLQDALTFLGSELSDADKKRLQALQHKKPGEETTHAIQEILDPYCLAVVSKIGRASCRERV